jgi:hypothetical protein
MTIIFLCQMYNTSDLKSELTKIDLSSFADNMTHPEYRGYFVQDSGEHYKLLAYLSTLYSGQVIYEIGTHFGNSLIALTYNPEVRVISYDIENTRQLRDTPLNAICRIGDFRKDPEVLRAPFIFVDVDPHDGKQEHDFHDFFITNGYKGSVLWDDIHLNDAMQAWWDSVDEPNVTRINLTEVGHATGTGLLIYS